MSALPPTGRDDAPPDDWAVAEDVIAFVADPHVRESLQLGLERDREAWQQSWRHTKRFERVSKDVEQKFFVLFENDVVAMRTAKRIEDKIDTLIGDNRTSQAEIATLKQSQSAAMTAASTERLERIAAEKRLTATEAIIETMRRDVTASGQHAAIGEAFGRLALDSVHDEDDEKKEERAEQREIRKEKREFKWRTWHALVGIAGAVALLVAGAIVQAHYGPQTIHIPTPAGPASQEHHEHH